jgi:large subunit ribosomal protein L3
MSGHYGDETSSALNLRVAKIDAEHGLILIEGGVPGSRNAMVTIRGAIKRNGGKPKA